MELILGYSIVTAVIFIGWLISVIWMYNKNFPNDE